MFEITGLDELQRSLKKLQDNTRAIHGEHSVPLTELFPPAFIRAHTDFQTLGELFGAGGFTVETPEDFAAIPDEEWDTLIARLTDFPNWKAMQETAGIEWIARGIGLE